MSNRKKRTTINREITEDWTNTQLLELKKLADTIIEKLYPNTTTPLVETEDIVGSYLNQYMPFKPTSTRPYIEWCMHKYPPYLLSVDNLLITRSFQLHSKKYPNVPIDSSTNLILPIEGDFAINLINLFYKRYAHHVERDKKNLIQHQIDTLDYLEKRINSIFLTESQEFNTQYKKNRSDLISYRKDKLKNDLKTISQDPLLQDLEGDKKLGAIFDTFFTQFPIQAGENTDTCKTVIKYRFFVHVIILFLKVAGSAKSNDYTPTRIKQYREVVKENEDDPFSGIRHRLEKTPVHNTLPSADELKGIKTFSNKLFALLHGRTEKYDLLMHLNQLANPQKGDFIVDGRISTKKNLEIRSFIKSLTMFFCLYHYDRLSAYSMALTEQEFNIEFNKITENITQLTEQITDIFFYDVTTTLIKTNAKEIYEYIQKLVIDHKKLYDFTTSESTEEARVIAQRIEFMKENNHSHPSLLHYIKNVHDASSDAEERKQWCRELQLTTCGSYFWSDLFDYYGQVNSISGTVELNKLEPPTHSKKDLEAHLLRAISLIKQQKKDLLRGKYFPRLYNNAAL